MSLKNISILLPIMFSFILLNQSGSNRTYSSYSSEPFNPLPKIKLSMDGSNLAYITLNYTMHSIEDREVYTSDGTFIRFSDDPSYVPDGTFGNSSKVYFSECMIGVDPASLFARRFLDCVDYSGKHVQLYDKDTSSILNSRTQIQNLNVVLLAGRVATTTTDVMFRTMPDRNSESLTIIDDEHQCCAPSTGPVEYKAIPRDRTIFLLARSLEISHVDQYSNYWYYILVYHRDGHEYLTGWVFGQFIQ